LDRELKDVVLLIRNVKDLMEKWNGKCVVCLIFKGSLGDHNMMPEFGRKSCPVLSGRCWKCIGSGHGSNNACPLKDFLFQTGSCFGCGLPGSVYDEPIHEGDLFHN
jgi:hypothetical protein